MPAYESLAAFQRQWAKLDAAQRAAFRGAVAVFIANLKAGEGFSPELRVHKLVNTQIWSLTWAKDGRALFRSGPEITPGQTHITWKLLLSTLSPATTQKEGCGGASANSSYWQSTPKIGVFTLNLWDRLRRLAYAPRCGWRRGR
jgi:hypothetical protein